MRSAIRSWSLFVPPSVVERFYDAGLEAKVGVTRCEAGGDLRVEITWDL